MWVGINERFDMVLTRREVEIDTRIADFYMRLFKKDAERDTYIREMGRQYGFRNSRASIDEIEQTLMEKGSDVVVEKLELLTKRVMRALATYHEASKEYGGWSRFYSVPGGHIHSSMFCSTCNKMGNATRFIWNPKLSGLTEADAVKMLGPALCTICFPSAPVSLTQGTLGSDGTLLPAKDYCPGSGTSNYNGTPRIGYAVGNGGHCGVCNKWVSVKSKYDNSMRRHLAAKD